MDNEWLDRDGTFYAVEVLSLFGECRHPSFCWWSGTKSHVLSEVKKLVQLLLELLSDSIWQWWSDSFLDRSLDCTSTILILRFLSNYVLSFLLEDMGHWYDDGVCVVRFYRGEIWGVGSYLSKGTYCILFRQLIFLRPEMIDCYEFLTRNLKHKIFSWKKKD